MKKYLIALLLLGAVHWSPVWAQKEKFKALFIYNFIKNVEWPAQSKSGQFTIGVIGNQTIASELQTIAQTQKAGGLPIKVENFSSVNEASNCQLVYLASAKSGMLGNMVSLTNGKAILIVGDGKDLATKGAGISFVIDGEKLKFDICRKHIESHGLKCSASLMNLGTPVESTL
jgi:hypothetical protein